MNDDLIKKAKRKMNDVKQEILKKQDELNKLINEYQKLCDELYKK